MRHYYRHDAESERGEEGTVYFEFTDDVPTRQVEVYGDHWRWGDAEHPDHLADQSFPDCALGVEHQIGRETFEELWIEALRRCP